MDGRRWAGPQGPRHHAPGAPEVGPTPHGEARAERRPAWADLAQPRRRLTRARAEQGSLTPRGS